MRDNGITKSQEAASARLTAAGLRPTRQRIALAELLFREEHRHLTAEHLHAEVLATGMKVSLATVYNTLHQLTSAGLLSQISIDAGCIYFDTNVHDHQHFYVEDEGRLIDIPGLQIGVTGIPDAPAGLAVKRVDVVVRLSRNSEASEAL